MAIKMLIERNTVKRERLMPKSNITEKELVEMLENLFSAIGPFFIVSF